MRIAILAKPIFVSFPNFSEEHVAKEFFHSHEGAKAVKEMRIPILAKPIFPSLCLSRILLKSMSQKNFFMATKVLRQ